MRTTPTTATVVPLESHPTWRANRRRSNDIAAAMRRHPSCWGMSHPETPARPGANVLVLPDPG